MKERKGRDETPFQRLLIGRGLAVVFWPRSFLTVGVFCVQIVLDIKTDPLIHLG